MFEPAPVDPDKPGGHYSANRVTVNIHEHWPKACIDKITAWTWGWVTRTQPGRIYIKIREEEADESNSIYQTCATARAQRKYFLHNIDLHRGWFDLDPPARYEVLIHELYHYALSEVQDAVIDDEGPRGAERLARITRACESVVTQLARSYVLAHHPEDLRDPEAVPTPEATTATEAPAEL